MGTWEGWVPTPTDLYLRGNNPAGFTQGEYLKFRNIGTCKFESGQLTCETSDEMVGTLCTNRTYNISGYKKLNIRGWRLGGNGFITVNIHLGSSKTDPDIELKEFWDISTGTVTVSVDISLYDVTKYIGLFFRTSAGFGTFAIDRIWIS